MLYKPIPDSGGELKVMDKDDNCWDADAYALRRLIPTMLSACPSSALMKGRNGYVI